MTDQPAEVVTARGWRIKREFSIGDLIAIAAASVGILTSYFTMDKRVSLLEDKALAQRVIDAAQDQGRTAMAADIRDQLTEIKVNQRRTEDKIDRVLERRR